MPIQTQEARIILAIETIRTIKKMSIRQVIKMYDVLESSFRYRIKGRIAKAEIYHGRHQLTLNKKETIVRYILDLDSRGFSPRIGGIEDIANLLLTTRGAKRVGKQ